MAVNKFLGLDSINVIKKYVDEKIDESNLNSRLITIHAYKYVIDGEYPNTPTGGIVNNHDAEVVYPDGWYSLTDILVGKTPAEIESMLALGSIWMSVGLAEGGNSVTDWSNPMKISGQNGVSVRFAYSYNADSTESQRTNKPSGVNSDNRIEYVWMKFGDEDWSGPTIWSMYSHDAQDIHWRYLVTSEVDDNGDPIIPSRPTVGSSWSNTIPTKNLSSETPFMWMSFQKTAAGASTVSANWSDPILFGHWGKNGENGNVPDYVKNIYCKGTNTELIPEPMGIIAPNAPEFVENTPVSAYIDENWKEMPENDNYIWWICTLKVNGKTDHVLEVGPVKRYNAIDGDSKPGSFEIRIYKWSSTQLAPETSEDGEGWKPEGWYEKPDYELAEDYTGDKNSESPIASLWMRTATANGLTEDGLPNITEWSEPIKVSGPQGPISYDYRVEVRYSNGTETEPSLGEDVLWENTAPEITAQYPYIWAQSFLMCYKMVYSGEYDNDGYPKIVEDETTVPEILNRYGYYRISGINGVNGNRKNGVHYFNEEASQDINVIDFSTQNYFIANSESPVTYNLKFNPISFMTGYTGKFANIGTNTCTIKISSGDYKFIGSCTTATELVLQPQETVELVCYVNGDQSDILVIGKELS